MSTGAGQIGGHRMLGVGVVYTCCPHLVFSNLLKGHRFWFTCPVESYTSSHRTLGTDKQKKSRVASTCRSPQKFLRFTEAITCGVTEMSLCSAGDYLPRGPSGF